MTMSSRARGRTAALALSPRELAEIEYEAGVDSAAANRDSDVGYFQRVLQLDPDHVNAHLQLAAYGLIRGSAQDVETHLAAVRKVAPRNASASEIERLLRRLKNQQG
jgi:hypothetical protein